MLPPPQYPRAAAAIPVLEAEDLHTAAAASSVT
jgi:hypothetical protein